MTTPRAPSGGCADDGVTQRARIECRAAVQADRGSSEALACLLDHPELDTGSPKHGAAATEPAGQELEVSVDEHAIVGLFLAPASQGLYVDPKAQALQGLDLALARMVNRSPALVEVRRLTTQERWTVRWTWPIELCAGDARASFTAAEEPATVALQPQRLASLRASGMLKARRVCVVDPKGGPVPGARVYSDRGVAVADLDGGLWTPSDELWAVSDVGMCTPTREDQLVLDQPRQRCRFVDATGVEVAPTTWCDAIAIRNPDFLGVWCTLQREDEQTVVLKLQDTLHLRLPGILPLDHLDEATLVDASGRSVELDHHYVHVGLARGPATLTLGMGARRWVAQFELGRLRTEVRPEFTRQEA